MLLRTGFLYPKGVDSEPEVVPIYSAYVFSPLAHHFDKWLQRDSVADCFFFIFFLCTDGEDDSHHSIHPIHESARRFLINACMT